MSPNTILYVIIGISLAAFLFEQLLEVLNLSVKRRELPAEIASFYDRDKYEKSLNYHEELTRFGFLTSGLGFLGSMIMLIFGGFGTLDAFLRTWFQSELLLALAFFGVLLIVSDVLTLPFQLYSIFVIEEKYGFNKMTLRTFMLDKLKSYVLAGILGGGLLALLIVLLQWAGPGFWIWFGSIAAVFILAVNMFYTTLLLPLFNKLTPLPDGELKSAIEAFARRIDFPIDSIFVMDGSKRSAKANAFFSGIGSRKKIVLYDTLIKNHTTGELVAVLAHEVGHFKKKHIVWSYVLSILQVFIMLYILSRMVFDTNLSLALGGSEQAIHLNLLAFGILYSPISGILRLGMSLLSRRNEFEADAYARETYDGSALGTALKKLSVDNLSNLYPHPAYVFFHYSHPPLLQRLKALEKNSFR
ncbi:MAG TPA: M48 family metallopeptidase [Cyclobacteriaceae bacterium]|nr:M48 family metallopeptidase [Cyclobacteriaceae bacterium]